VGFLLSFLGPSPHCSVEDLTVCLLWKEEEEEEEEEDRGKLCGNFNLVAAAAFLLSAGIGRGGSDSYHPPKN